MILYELYEKVLSKLIPVLMRDGANAIEKVYIFDNVKILVCIDRIINDATNGNIDMRLSVKNAAGYYDDFCYVDFDYQAYFFASGCLNMITDHYFVASFDPKHISDMHICEDDELELKLPKSEEHLFQLSTIQEGFYDWEIYDNFYKFTEDSKNKIYDKLEFSPKWKSFDLKIDISKSLSYANPEEQTKMLEYFEKARDAILEEF